MARYSTSLDVGKEMESEPVKPINPPAENEEQVTLDETPEADEPEEEEFLEQKRAKKAEKRTLTQKQILDETPDEELDEGVEQKNSVNYAKQFLEMDEEDDASEIQESVDAPAAYEEVVGTEKIIQTPEEQDIADIIREQKFPHKRIQKSEQKKQINKTAQKQQSIQAQKQAVKQEKPVGVQSEEKSELALQERTSWGWIAALIILILLAGTVWKYWPQTTQPGVMPEIPVVLLEASAQNNTQVNNSLDTRATSEYESADDALAELSDQLKG